MPIVEVARALALRIGVNGNIHCWHPDAHENGDRTASVGVRRFNNTVKCFGCGIGPLGPIDLVMAVEHLQNPGTAALWIAERFVVPKVPVGAKLVQPDRPIFQFGRESDIDLLVYSGVWSMLSPTSCAIVPVMLTLAERDEQARTISLKISYRALGRYSGVSSPNAIAGALRELQEIGWLSIHAGSRLAASGPVRDTSTYVLTPRSDELLELAQDMFRRMRQEIEIERRLRQEARNKRKRCVY